MIRRLRPVLAAAALLPLAAAGGAPAAAEEPVVLARSMLEVLAPRSNDIVGVLIDSLDAEGEIHAANVSEDGWAAIEAALADLQAETARLRGPIQVVAEPGDTIFGEETSGLSAADVQAMIDADRAAFDYYVDLMLADFAEMEALIAARDAAGLWAIADVLDVKCNACHERFWYPDWQESDQPAP